QLGHGVLDERRLVHLGGGEAREPRALALDDSLRLLAGHGREEPLGQLQRRHGRTPTWTPRNRAGAAPWDTCAYWPGWPLPQFVRPCSRHSSGPPTPAREAQKRGVTPV